MYKTTFLATVSETSIRNVLTSHVRVTALELVVLHYNAYEQGPNQFA